MTTLEEIEARLSVVEQILIERGMLTIEAMPDMDEVEFIPETPKQLRDNGQPFCPGCFTFGATHSKKCKYKDSGMANHIVRKKG